MSRIGDLLRDAPAPDEHGAEERAWRMVSSAFGERGFEPRRAGRPRRPLVVALATLVLLALLALSPVGPAVADWLDDAFHPGRRDAGPALVELPARGRLLVTSGRGPWVVKRDGSKRRLGRYQEAGWSPGGLFVAVTTRHELVAVEPDGDPRWSLARAGPVRNPAWSPDGFRIAYRSGHDLRVVAGDGSGDALLARRVAPVAPAWRPRGSHVLAYADGQGRVVVERTDLRRRVWRAQTGAVAERLEWTPDGRELLMLSSGGVRVFDRRGRLLSTFAAPPQARTEAVAVHPGGVRVALVRYDARTRRSEVLDVPLAGGSAGHRLFAGAGRFSDVAWSPDGRWLLIAWPDANQWLFVRASGRPRVTAVSGIARQFDPGGRGKVFPRIAGWCCAPGTP